MHDLTEIRIRLGRSDEDGRRAWESATGLARRAINSNLEAFTTHATLEMMATELEAAWQALQSLKEVHELLAQRAGHPPRTPVSPHIEPLPCVTCGRLDRLFQVTICARCM